MSDTVRRGALIGGFILILVGVLFLLENWYPDFSFWDHLVRYWPILFILFGFRSLYRYFAYKLRPGTLIEGVILILLGSILLAKRIGYDLSFWRTAAKFWPILLILLGLAKMYEYVRQKDKVSIRFSDVLLAILICLFGLFSRNVAAFDLDLFTWDFPHVVIGKKVQIRDRIQSSYAFAEELSQKCPSASPIKIDNLNGNIQVTPSAVEEMKVTLRKVVYENSESKAREVADKIKLDIKPENEGFSIKTNRDLLKGKNYEFETNLEIAIPKKSSVTITNKHGDTKVEGLVGGQQITSSYGRVEVNNVEGPVKITNTEDAVTISGVNGHVEVGNRNAKVDVKQIHGNLTVDNSFSETAVSDVSGDLRIQNKNGTVRIEKIKKSVFINASGSKIEGTDISGELKIEAAYNGPMVLENIAASATINSSNGSVRATNVKGHLNINADYADLVLSSVGQGLTVRGKSSSVQAEQIQGPVDIRTSRKDVALSSFSDRLMILNEHADISLEATSKLKTDLEIKNQYGKINLVLPENSGFRINALSRSGSVESEFSAASIKISNDVDGKITGSYGAGGPTIKLETSYADISLRKGSKVTKAGL